MGYPRTLAALREQEDRSWAVADALVAEIETSPGGRAVNGEYERCRTYLAANGYEVTVDYLVAMRATARKFSSEERKWRVPYRFYHEAARTSGWTPGLMEQAELNGWTLRQFGEKLTGRRWADDDLESARRVLADPARAAEVLDGMDAARRGDLVRGQLADPAVADAAFNRTDHQQSGSITQTALGNVSRAHLQGEQRRMAERQAEMPDAARETNEKISRTGAKLDLDAATLEYKTACGIFQAKIAAALAGAGPYQGGDGPLSYAQLVEQTVTLHRGAGHVLEILAEYVSGSQPGTSLSDEVAAYLAGGEQ